MYDQTFSRHNPGCIVILLDRSDSMKQDWQGSGTTLAKGAALALNKVLLDLCIKSTKEVGGAARHYFDIGVFGYGACPTTGGEGVESALGGALAGQPLVALPALFSNPLAVREEAAVPALASASRESSVDAMPMLSRMPIWVEPISGYRTPMCQAISVAGSHIYDWVGAHPNSFPPIVINITDGLVTDSPYEGADLTEWAQRLVSIETNDGPLLLLNIFLSAAGQTEVLFPSSANQLPEPGPDLFAISSPLPPAMVANARAGQLPMQPGARGFVFNAGLSSLVKFLEIGTRVADIRAH